MTVIICSFSGAIADLPKGQRTTIPALRVLAKNPRVSCFDQGDNLWLCWLLRDMVAGGLIVSDPDARYPWNRYTLTDKGRAMLGDGREAPTC